MLFLIAQIRRFGTLNATQKTAALYKAPFLKESRKTARNQPFLLKNAFLTIFRKFFLIFSRLVLCRGLGFFALRYGQKVNRSRKKVKIIFKKKSERSDQMEKENGWQKLVHHKWCFRTRSTVHVQPLTHHKPFSVQREYGLREKSFILKKNHGIKNIYIYKYILSVILLIHCIQSLICI